MSKGGEGITKEVQIKLIEIGVGVLLYTGALFGAPYFELDENVQLILFVLAYLAMSVGTFWMMLQNVKKRKLFDENLLIVLATVGAFLIGKYAEAVAVMLFFQVGRLCEELALNHSKKSIEKFIDIRPDYANRKTGDSEEVVEPGELQIRDIIVIKQGERIPVDAVIIKGISTIDTKALTGEMMPQEVQAGDHIYSGSINISGVLEARVVKVYGESTAARILSLVQNAGSRKAKSQDFVDRFNRYYTPIVAALGLGVMIIPSVTFGSEEASTWVYRGLIMLVTACPCGLLISVPLAFFGGISAASRQGVLIKGSNFLENLAQTETFVFDKTGTLTKGVFEVQEICPRGFSEAKLLELMAYGESYSNHPIAASLREAYGEEIDKKRVQWVKEFPGFGVRAIIDKKKVFIGNARFMKQQHIEFERIRAPGTAVHIAVEEEYAGYILIADTIREDAKETIRRLNRYEIEVIMLTGDNERVAEAIAKELGIENVYSNLMPEDKVEQIEIFMESRMENEKLAFVGDGLNDAPVLARADVGIAMGGLGSDAAIEAADIVLMEDEPYKIINAIRISKETIRVVKQNMVFTIGTKVLLLLLASIGYVSMRGAIIADVVVMMINLLNSFWMLRYPE